MGITECETVARQQMNERELAEVRELEGLCNRQEGLTMKLNWGMLHERKPLSGETNDFLRYGGEGKLIGYLALYGFGRSEIEVSGMVHPDYRRKGIFSGLLEQARAECVKRGLKSFLFICERKSEAGNAFVKAKAASFDHSEHRMELPGNSEPVRAGRF